MDGELTVNQLLTHWEFDSLLSHRGVDRRAVRTIRCSRASTVASRLCYRNTRNDGPMQVRILRVPPFCPWRWCPTTGVALVRQCDAFE